MPIHDWKRVDAGIFHAFHFDWIFQIAHELNNGLLPEEYYALPEQFASKFGPDVLTLQESRGDDADTGANGLNSSGGNGAVLTAPCLQPVGETDLEFYRRKQKVIVVRHVSDDEIAAVIEIVSRGNKAGRKAIGQFVGKAGELIDRGIHLLIVDLFPPGRLDPQGIHGEIWEHVSGEEYTAPADKPFTLASYETGNGVRAYVLHAALGDAVPDMPLFLEPQQTVTVPLEQTYNAAFVEMPLRWRRVLE